MDVHFEHSLILPPHPCFHKEIIQRAVDRFPTGMFRSGVFCPKAAAVITAMKAAGQAWIVEVKPTGEPVSRLGCSPHSLTSS